MTADSNQTAGVRWATAVPVGSVFYMANTSVVSTLGGQIVINGLTYNAPEGYLICNGDQIGASGVCQNINVSSLSVLKTFLGTTYGANFNLPNLINNFIGYSAVPGQIGGTADATLVAHRHFVASSGTDLGKMGNYAGNLDAHFTISGFVGNDPRQDYVGGAGSTTPNYGGSSIEGENQTGKNIPPYVGMLPVIKY